MLWQMAVVFDLTAESEEKGPAACDFAHVRDTRLKAACEHTNKLTDTGEPTVGTRGGGRGGGSQGRKRQVEGGERRRALGWRMHRAARCWVVPSDATYY